MPMDRAKKWVFPAYLVFTVAISSYHYIMQWGPAETTNYEADTPTSIKIIKDVVWIALLVWYACGSDAYLFGKQIRRNLKLAICCGLFCFWMFLLGFAKLLTGEEPSNVILYWIRYPLEYIPMAFLVAGLMPEPEKLKHVAIACCWLVAGFFLFEVAANRGTGFDFRYGSIFGSPNDFGMFAAFTLLIFILSGTNWLLAVLMFAGLLGSLSRSSWVAFVVGYISLLDIKRARMIALAAVLLSIALGAYVYQKFDLAQVSWVGNLGARVVTLDESATIRQDEFAGAWSRLTTFDVALWMFGSKRYIHQENFYLALIMRAGVPALLLFLAVQWMTLKRAWKFRHQPIIRFALCVVLTVTVGSAFIPFPDVFPTNFYFWAAIGIIHTDHFCHVRDKSIRQIAGNYA
jgi:hypothetical protein